MDWGNSPTCPMTAIPESTTARTDAALCGPPPTEQDRPHNPSAYSNNDDRGFSCTSSATARTDAALCSLPAAETNRKISQ